MIVRHKPEVGLDEADMAWFDSDAKTNTEAIREINEEAAQHGLVRTREYWLQTFSLPDGRVIYRGFCYRPGPSDADAILQRIANRRGLELEGMPSSEMIRLERDA